MTHNARQNFETAAKSVESPKKKFNDPRMRFEEAVLGVKDEDGFTIFGGNLVTSHIIPDSSSTNRDVGTIPPALRNFGRHIYLALRSMVEPEDEIVIDLKHPTLKNGERDESCSFVELHMYHIGDGKIDAPHVHRQRKLFFIKDRLAEVSRFSLDPEIYRDGGGDVVRFHSIVDLARAVNKILDTDQHGPLLELPNRLPTGVPPVPMHHAMPTIEETIDFIKEVHKGQKDKIGNPYWKHPIEVMNALPPYADHEVKLAALLHDVLEDNKEYTREKLLARGYTERTLRIVEHVTFVSSEIKPYEDQIVDLISSGNIDAIMLKHADMSRNNDPARLSKVPDPHQSRLKKKYRDPFMELDAVMKFYEASSRERLTLTRRNNAKPKRAPRETCEVG